jgi:hypothetical protein
METESQKKSVVSEKAKCKCSFRCYARLGRVKRQKIRAAFQQMDRPQQKAYMRGLIDLNKVKFKGTAMQLNRRRAPRKYTVSLFYICIHVHIHIVCIDLPSSIDICL